MNKNEPQKGVITPKKVKEAFKHLPSNYVKLTVAVLEDWKANGEIEKVYGKDYIKKVKNGTDGAFNEDIMRALVAVGLENKEKKKQFGK